VQRALTGIDGEVFVVDNNSVDGSIALIREKFPSVKLLHNHENLGFARANNQAIVNARGTYVLLLNPDTVVQEDTFRKALLFMDAHPDAGALGIKMLDGKGNFLPESKRGLPTPSVAFYKIFGLSRLFPHSRKFGQYHLTYLGKEQSHEVDVLSGAFMLIRNSVLEKVGLLDETFFMYGEDIDLSYRITQAGYRNYYFAGSSIIHYKGESTKKSSVNYVVVFYKAMAIFANKHFSHKHARLFTFLIHLAIYLRAGAAILARFVKQLFFPAIDFALILAGLYFCKTVYEVRFKLYPNFYSAEILNFFFPLYTLTWMTFVFFSGGYDRPVSLRRISRGVLTGSLFILIIYSLLPEYYRFSRALILIGSIYAWLVYMITRLIYSKAGIRRFRLGGPKAGARIGIVGSGEEFSRVKELLQKTRVKAEFIGHISPEPDDLAGQEVIGNFRQVNEAIEVHRLGEIIFCARDISSSQIIDKMIALVTKGIEFKIAPPESLSIIGSSSIDTAGELYVIDVNNVGKPENRRNKRLVDFLSALVILLFSPVLVWFQHRPGNFFSNIFRVMAGLYSWVGYGKVIRKDLPSLKPSVFSPADMLANGPSEEKVNRALLAYSKDYKVENDLGILWKHWNKLGR
jgi:O-antigen biosynthesis protein